MLCSEACLSFVWKAKSKDPTLIWAQESFQDLRSGDEPQLKNFMNTYSELQAKKAELDKRIAEVFLIEKAEAFTQIKSLIDTFGFTLQEVFPLPQNHKKAPAKFYDPSSGKSWSGRGKVPRWMEGKDRRQFEIDVTPSVDFTAPRDDKNPFPVQW